MHESKKICEKLEAILATRWAKRFISWSSPDLCFIPSSSSGVRPLTLLDLAHRLRPHFKIPGQPFTVRRRRSTPSAERRRPAANVPRVCSIFGVARNRRPIWVNPAVKNWCPVDGNSKRITRLLYKWFVANFRVAARRSNGALVARWAD